jgi:cell division septum initiation protein DivIVA
MNRIFLLLFLFGLNLSAFSQVICCNIIVEKDIEFDTEVRDVFKLEINEDDTKLVLNSWASYVRKNTKSRLGEPTGGYQKAKDGRVKGIGRSGVDITSYLVDSPKGMSLFVGLFVDSVYINPSQDGEVQSAAKEFLENFFIEVQKDIYSKQLDEARDVLKELESKHKSANRDADRIRKRIASKESEVQDFKQEVERNENEQSLRLTQIKSKREELIILPREAKNQRKIVNKDIKALERDIKKLKKQNNRLQNRVKDSEGDKRELQFDLEKASKEADYHAENVAKQNKKVLELRNKIRKL